MDAIDLTNFKTRLGERKVVPVVGASVSIATANMPTWTGLISAAIAYGRSHNAETDLLDIAELALTLKNSSTRPRPLSMRSREPEFSLSSYDRRLTIPKFNREN